MQYEKMDLVVIGGGGAGLAAALTALENGLEKVMVLEKRGLTGGNSALAGGHLFATETRFQKEAGTVISCDAVFSESMQFHHYTRVEPKILRAFIDKSASTIDWVEQDLGIPYSGGGITNYMVNGPLPFGNFIQATRAMTEKIKALGGTILLNTWATGISRDEAGAVCAVSAENAAGEHFTVETQAAAITTGGFTGNSALLHHYFPDQYDDIYYTDAVLLDGDGIALAKGAGAALTDYCTIIKENAYSCDSGKNKPNRAAHQPRCIWVNRLGQRFQDESKVENESTNALVQQPGKIGYAIFDEDIMEYTSTHSPFPAGMDLPIPDVRAQFRAEAAETGDKWVKIADSLEEIAQWMGADSAVLRNTIEEYNGYCDAGRDALFAKDPEFLMPLRRPPFYAIKFRPILIDTIGPIRVNEKMQVLDAGFKPIPGLYAAGVITSGWQGVDYHLHGSALGYSINSGRIVGENAAALGRP